MARAAGDGQEEYDERGLDAYPATCGSTGTTRPRRRSEAYGTLGGVGGNLDRGGGLRGNTAQKIEADSGEFFGALDVWKVT